MSNCGQCGGGGAGGVCTCFVENTCGPQDTFFVDLPGTTGNYASTPHAANHVDAGNNLDMRVRVTMDDWTPAARSVLLSKYGLGGFRAFVFEVNNAGTLRYFWTADGSAPIITDSTAAVAAAAGTAKWVRVTHDIDNGAAGNNVKFYTSDDYDPYTETGTWTQLGTTVTTAGVTSIFDAVYPLEIGARGGGVTEPLAGNIYYAELRDGINGNIVAKFDPADTSPVVGTMVPSVFVSSTNETWTINGAAWTWGVDPIDPNTCVEARGNGSISHPFNFVPERIPNPRPCGNIARITSTQAVPADTYTTVIFNTDSHPFTGGMTNLAGAPTRLTAPVDGVYLVGGFAVLSGAGVASVAIIIIQTNGSTTQRQVMNTYQDPTAANLIMGATTLIRLLASEYIELIVRSTSAVNVAITNSDFDGTYNCPAYLWAQWMGF